MTTPSRAATAARWQFAFFVIVVVAWCGTLFAMPVDPDYTAGELLDHLQAWRETGVLYPALGADTPLRVLNYPPLVLAIARGVAAIGLSPLLAGRVVNAVGLLGVVSAMVFWLRARGVRGAALTGTIGLLGASIPFLFATGQFHIELWAIAGTLWGFALLQRALTARQAVLCGVVLATACFAKQTQVVPGIAALAWLWWQQRKQAAVATAAFTIIGITGSALITVAFGAEAWRHMLSYTVGTYSWANLLNQVFSNVGPWAILALFISQCVRASAESGVERCSPDGFGASLQREPVLRESVLRESALREPALREPALRASLLRDPLGWYLVSAFVWAIASARIGSSYQYFLELHIAFAMIAGPRMFGEGTIISRWWTRALTAQVVCANLAVASVLAFHVSQAMHTRRELPALCAAVRAQSRTIAEEAGVMRACARPALLHPFVMAALAREGRWNAAQLERQLQNGEYPLVILPFDPTQNATGAHADRWTVAELAAFRAAPLVEKAATGRWFVRW